MTTQMNFKKAFTIFFAAFAVFALMGLFLGAWGQLAGDRLIERLLLTGFRERLFTDPLTAFRNVSYLFLVGFHVLLAMWVSADCKRNHTPKTLWTLATTITGLIGWLAYMISRKDNNTVQVIETRKERI